MDSELLKAPCLTLVRGESDRSLLVSKTCIGAKGDDAWETDSRAHIPVCTRAGARKSHTGTISPADKATAKHKDRDAKYCPPKKHKSTITASGLRMPSRGAKRSRDDRRMADRTGSSLWRPCSRFFYLAGQSRGAFTPSRSALRYLVCVPDDVRRQY